VGTELAAICKRNEINFFDPTNLFREKASDVGKKGDGLYFKKMAIGTASAISLQGRY